MGPRSWRQSVRETKLGLVFLCSVCLYTAHVAPSNMKLSVSSYKYTINAISNLFFCHACESKFGNLKEKNLIWCWCILIVPPNICAFTTHTHHFDELAKALKVFRVLMLRCLMLRGGTLKKVHLASETHFPNDFLGLIWEQFEYAIYCKESQWFYKWWASDTYAYAQKRHWQRSLWNALKLQVLILLKHSEKIHWWLHFKNLVTLISPLKYDFF